uniref:Uncharacterized protein n=1 Tax=Picornavirales sp. TaxID=1955153 RepID=A0A6M3YP20_9VIRU|nr:MAG: hypothetical protein 3 [Picornavirales sp.]
MDHVTFRAPQLRRHGYIELLRTVLTTSIDMLEAIRAYPKAPSTTNLVSHLRNIVRHLEERDIDESRLELGRALQNHKSLFQFDAGDAVSRGLLRSINSMLHTGHQNIIDNIKAAKKTFGSPGSGIRPTKSRVYSAGGFARSVPNLQNCGKSSRRGRSPMVAPDRCPDHTGRCSSSNTFTRPYSSANSHTGTHGQAHATVHTSVNKPTPFHISSGNGTRIARCPESVVVPLIASRRSPSPSGSEDWTEQDARDFDYATYYGSETWFLE